MKVLLIEDNHSKLKCIKNFLESTYPDFYIHDAVSLTAGLRRLYDETWDLVLLDMSLPVYDMSIQDTGGEKKPIAGREVMKRMFHRGIIIPTIVVTQFDTFGENSITIESLNEEFNSNLNTIWKGTVNYENPSWNRDLKVLIDEIMGDKDDKNPYC